MVGECKALGFKAWITDEILQQMERKKPAKIEKEYRKYTQLYREIRWKVRQANNNWLTEQFMEAEELHQKHDSFNYHKKIEAN